MKAAAPFALALLVSFAAAAAPPSDESIERLFALTEVETNMQVMHRMMDGMARNAMEQAARQRQATPEQRAKMQAAYAKTQDVMREEMSWAKLKPIMIRVYAETFTQEEVDSMLAFYESPGGRALTAKMPIAAQKSMTLMQERLGPVLRRLESELKETVEAR